MVPAKDIAEIVRNADRKDKIEAGLGLAALIIGLLMANIIVSPFALKLAGIVLFIVGILLAIDGFFGLIARSLNK